MNIRSILCIIILCTTHCIVAQKPASMTVNDLITWKRIVDKNISNDGKWVYARMDQDRGDAILYIYNVKGEEEFSFTPAKKGEFSAAGYMLVTKTTPQAVLDSLKLAKTKEDKMPMDKLLIVNLTNRQVEEIDSVRSYKLSEDLNRIAYQRGNKNDSTLYVRSLNKQYTDSFPVVSDYAISKENGLLCFVTKGDTLGKFKAGLYSSAGNVPAMIMEGKGVFKQMTIDEKGNNIAFLYCSDKDSVRTNYDLYIAESGKTAYRIAERNSIFMPPKWVISENRKLSFSKKSGQLLFGIAPEPKQKDTTAVEELRPEVQVWNWNEPVQYTVQNYNRTEDLKKTYTTLYNMEARTFVQLTSPEITNVQILEDDNVQTALLTTSVPYNLESMWEEATRYDTYIINLLTGDKRRINEGIYGRTRLSPQGKYAYWYNPLDSSWYTYSVNESKEYRLTRPESFAAWDENNDVPSHPNAHGSAGWTADDASILIYDRYDIWQFNPKGASAPVNLTVNGRKDRITYRRITLDTEETFIDTKQMQFLRGFNQTTKGYGYYSAKFTAAAVPQTLIAGNYLLSTPVKARKADAIIYTMESYSMYPDLQLSDLKLKRSVQLTKGYLQQQPFIWGTAELVAWTSLNGKHLEGVVYKPANFDPSRKYPLIVNFYERNSETLNSFHNPEVGRSTIDYHLYNSNGYLIFNPDVVYDDGHPGESCYRCVMPGISSLISKGYIDEKAIGVQGHSWGGYQDAYLATRTNIFAAIESGAPVVNMFSAYGGIRWGTGLNRSFQYEHGQSRIGASIWEQPNLYIENSPLFSLDKITTPILIMANDNDGHVPWYQGIEFFIGMKRLQKPAWLLNYMGEPHWPTKISNRVDFQTRMFQFFEHYLQKKDMPKWMKEGVPAVERDFELGY